MNVHIHTYVYILKHQTPNQQHETSKQVLHFPVDLVVWGDVRLEVLFFLLFVTLEPRVE